MESEFQEAIDSEAVIGPAIQKAAVLTGVVGAVFAVLFLLSLWLLHQAPRPKESDQAYIDFYSGDEKQKILIVGLYILPLSAVAFIWFTAAIRQWAARSTRAGSQLIGTVQLLSGVAFITLALASAAATIVPAVIVNFTDEPLNVDLAREFPLLGDAFLLVFGIRMAAMFVMTTTNICSKAGVMPKWFTYLSLLIAAILFLSYSVSIWLVVAFPLWVLAVSILIIIDARDPSKLIKRREAAGSKPSRLAPGADRLPQR